MPPDYVFCGLCGHRDVSLFEHIRSVHRMEIAEYERRCPNSPLFSGKLGRLVIDGRLMSEAGDARITRELFGVRIECPLLPGELCLKSIRTTSSTSGFRGPWCLPCRRTTAFC